MSEPDRLQILVDTDSAAQMSSALQAIAPSLPTSRQSVAVSADSGRIDQRRSVREIACKDDFYFTPAYVDRPRQSQLAIAVDRSESFRSHVIWAMRLVAAASRVIPGSTAFGFGHGIASLHVGMQPAPAGAPAGAPASLSLGDLAIILFYMRRRVPNAASMEVWLISDCLVPPGKTWLDYQSRLTVMRDEIASWKKVRVLDPTWYTSFERDDGTVALKGTDVAALAGRQRRWRLGESEQTFELNALARSMLESQLADTAVMTAQRFTPLLRRLPLHVSSRRLRQPSLPGAFFGQ
jgi:hypothetical protein